MFLFSQVKKFFHRLFFFKEKKNLEKEENIFFFSCIFCSAGEKYFLAEFRFIILEQKQWDSKKKLKKTFISFMCDLFIFFFFQEKNFRRKII